MLSDTANSKKGLFDPLVAWLQLTRLSALPSAISNVLLGFLLVHESWQPVFPLVLLILASASLYTAGMILNDVFDFQQDSLERTQRPLPSGRIKIASAISVSSGLLILGVLLATLAGWVGRPTGSVISFWPILISIALVVFILLYDGCLKSTWLGPVAMGLCRTLNVLLGASLVVPSAGNAVSPLGIPIEVWWVALAIGVYVAGVTLLAHRESSEQQNRLALGGAVILIAIGLAVIAFLPNLAPQAFEAGKGLVSFYPVIAGLIALPVLRRAVIAAVVASPKSIQTAVIVCLRSLIVIDALVCFLAVPHQPLYAIAILGLLIPSMLLGRWISST